MAAPVWQPGTIYIPGDIVQPVSGAPAAGQPIVNQFFTGSAAGWTLPAQFSYDGAVTFQPGSGSVRFNTVGNGFFTFQATAGIPINPGQQISATCMFQQGASSAGNVAGQVMLVFTGAGDAPLVDGVVLGNVVNDASNGSWKPSTVITNAPAGAAFVRIGGAANRIGQNLPAWFDQFVWNFTGAGTPAGLVYKAVQPASGVSGSQEPVWPPTVGVQVIDNTVTWEAIAATRVTWEASPVMVTGAVQPTWPTQIGESVSDGSLRWTAYSRRVEDVNCPNSKVVAIVQSKVFAADGDIVRFCATANPLDWTTERDAGYLPTGLQQANANDMSVLNQYRSNLVAFNPSVFQNWQADPDPEVMALIDQMDGIGSSWQQAARAVGNELFYLSQLGVRTVGIAGGSTNLQAGDVGMPVDPLIQDAIFVASQNGSPVRSTYYPSSGQYWLAFSSFPPTTLSLTGNLPDNALGEKGTYQYAVGGGISPLVVTIHSGSLPPGATMDSTGLVTYAYTVAGAYAWTVRVTDASGAFVDLPDTATISAAAMMVTNLRHYTGPAEAMTIAPANIPWTAGVVIDVVSLSPSGLYLIGADADSAVAARLQFLKFDPVNNTWIVLAAPATLPSFGPWSVSWHPSGDYVAIGVNATSDRVFVYRRTGDTFTKIADPAVRQANQSVWVKWSPDGTKLACSNGSSADNVWVYNFDASTGVLSGGKGGINSADQTATLAWVPNQNNRYLIRGNSSNMSLIDTTGSPNMTVVDSVTLAGAFSDATGGGWFADNTTLVTLGSAFLTNGPVTVWTIVPEDGANAINFAAYPATTTTIGPNKRCALKLDGPYFAIARDIAAVATPFVYLVNGTTMTPFAGIPTGATGTVTNVSWRGAH